MKIPNGTRVRARRDLYSPLGTLTTPKGTRGIITRQETDKGYFDDVVWVRFDGDAEDRRPYCRDLEQTP